jgi:16S rRNA processing protein RimM
VPELKNEADRPQEAPKELLRLVVGRIGKAQGLKGEVTVEMRTDDPELRFAPGTVLDTDPKGRGPLTVDRFRMQGPRLILGFTGFEDRTRAETLRNTLLVTEVDPAELPDDPEEFYDHQLVGLRVATMDGLAVGIVREMIHLPAQDLFAVRRKDGREVLIPFIAEFVPEVDLAARLIRIDPPPGLLELADPPESTDSPSPTAGSDLPSPAAQLSTSQSPTEPTPPSGE